MSATRKLAIAKSIPVSTRALRRFTSRDPIEQLRRSGARESGVRDDAILDVAARHAEPPFSFASATYGGPERVSTDLSTVAELFFDRYAYPDWLRTHSRLVGAIGAALAHARTGAGDAVDVEAVTLAAYLHDIGRSPLLKGDPREHNELSALVLAAEGLPKCVEPARRHAIYTVLDPATGPRTLDEKLVYIADRRGGMAIEPLDVRAKDTAARHPRVTEEIARAVPIALGIEREVFAGLPFTPAQLADHVRVPS